MLFETEDFILEAVELTKDAALFNAPLILPTIDDSFELALPTTLSIDDVTLSIEDFALDTNPWSLDDAVDMAL